MKALSYCIFVLFFVALPMYLLNAFVMPSLLQLQQTYTQGAQLAAHIAGQSQ